MSTSAPVKKVTDIPIIEPVEIPRELPAGVPARGRVLEHTDGVVRAEWARIICVFIQASEKTEDIYGKLCRSYPTVPMYVLHREQIAEILLRVTVLQSMREGGV